MKIIALLLSAFFCISVSNTQKKPVDNQKSHRIEKPINSQWTFNYFPKETEGKGFELPGFDDSKWPAISLPHTWSSYETTGEFHPFIWNAAEIDNIYWCTGWGWYRKHFTINRNYSDRKAFIKFDGVQKNCKAWLNGKYLGDNKGSNGSFGFDITDFLKPGEDNVLAVAVNNPKEEFKTLPATERTLDIYGGIYGDITIVLTNKLFIPLQGSSSNEGGTIVTTPQVSEKEGVVRVQTWVKNDNKQKKNCILQTSISDVTNKIVQVIKTDAVINSGQLYAFDQTSKAIKNPHLWSAKDPYQYKIYSEVIDGKEVVDTYTASSGLKFAIAAETTIPLTAERGLIVFEEVFIKKMNENTSITSQGLTVGEPVKIILTGSQQKITADRGSVAIITADIVDSKNNHVPGVTNTIKWNITGPATLTGPAVFESEVNNHHQMAKAWYKEMPVSNVIRSIGKPGKIHISVLASGLASGAFDIMAEEIQPDNSVIIEPVLVDEGRMPVARITLNVNRLDEVPREIETTTDDFNLSPSNKPGFAKAVRSYILKNNPSVDTASVELRALVDLLALHLLNNNGHLSADDYNFNVDHYNNCRLISGYINSTKLPPLFKEGLKRYYANSVIRQGSEKDAGEEMNWLNWIPSGGTVVFFQEGGTATVIKGAKMTGKRELADIIAVVYPVFVKYNDEAKERALTFISKMNPYIKVASKDQQKNRGENEKIADISYKAEKGKPILIPLLKFISE